MKIITIPLLFIAVFCDAQAVDSIKFFFTNSWGEMKPRPKSSDGYLGIYQLPGKNFKVMRFSWRDTTVDDGAYGPISQMLPDSVHPLFIVRGIKELKSGMTIKGTESYFNPILPGKDLSYSLGTKRYTISATGNCVKGSSGGSGVIHNSCVHFFGNTATKHSHGVSPFSALFP